MTTAADPAAGFLAAIRADPADDVSRLVYADWLDEHGQPGRAEFIRVQCELAAWPPCPRSHFANDYHGGMCPDCQGRAAPLRRRERELLDVTAHWSGWTHQTFDHLAYDVGVSTDGTRQHVRLYDARKKKLASFRCEFRRGFVAAVALPLAAWVGGACGRCEGTGWLVERMGEGTGAERDDCPECRGSGRTGGHGPALVRTCPLEEVRLTDREPTLGSSATGRSVWGWGRLPERSGTASVPAYLFDRLAGWLTRVDNWDMPGDGPFRWYATEADAWAALSAACLAWARRQPGP